MSVELKNNKFITYLLILISLFVLVLFTKDQFTALQYNSDALKQAQDKIVDARNVQENLQEIKNQVTQSGATTERFMTNFTENEAMDYLYMYQESVNTEATQLLITGISFTEEEENEFGFYEKTITVDAIVSSTATMKAFLSYLIAEDAKYRFMIQNFSYPNDQREGSFNISVPLKIFYR